VTSWPEYNIADPQYIEFPFLGCLLLTTKKAYRKEQ